MTALTILWRGSLESCNYGCGYCPFAKTHDDREALARDRSALERFEGWLTNRETPTSVLITPWGEALIRGYYRAAMTRLSHLPQIETIAVQTNLSCSVNWLGDADLNHIALWCTYHPGETDRAAFLRKIHHLEEMGARYSVGTVGVRDALPDIEDLRRDLPPKAYLWVNAYRTPPHRYSPDDIARITAIDPLFKLNTRTYPTKGRACWAGETAISVTADGTAHRCHFIPEKIGNIYAEDIDQALRPRACSAQSCRCHIGYAQLKDMDLQGLYGPGFLERRAPEGLGPDAASARLSAFLRAGKPVRQSPDRT